MNAQAQPPILVAGAGIAGLSVALALSAKGFSVRVFEKSAILSEVGAGLQLSPNATRLLDRVGVLRRLMPSAVSPDGVFLQDGKHGGTLLRIPFGSEAEKRWGAHYITCHRSDLQTALLGEARQAPNIQIHLAASVNHVIEDDTGVIAAVETGERTEEHRGSLLIGCDGVWSTLRGTTRQGEPTRFTGFIAWRATIAADQVPEGLFPNETGVIAWVGPKAHLVAYPIRSGKLVNLVIITTGDPPPKQWANSGILHDVQHQFQGWNPAIRKLIDAGLEWTCWPLFEMPDYRFLDGKRMIFIGDAAHALPPFAAQGAAMAIEDAFALARALSSPQPQWQHALKAFEKTRQARVGKVARRGAFNRFVYHATGPVAFARNQMMRLRPNEGFVADLDWLYSYDAEA
ncbi:MAG: FAD-dependent monooxygenase [Phyllobacterium sp.]